MPETLRGTVERVTFFNPENGFAVLKVSVAGRRDLAAVVGTISLVTVGEFVEATGAWVIDAQHGPQFKADELRATHPTSAAGIERYLGSGAIRSVGPQLAARIVAIYKERSLEIIDQCPDMLLHIRGIGRQRLEKITSSWRQQKEVRQIMLFLHELGIGAGYRATASTARTARMPFPRFVPTRTSWRTTCGESGSRPLTRSLPAWASIRSRPSEPEPRCAIRCSS